MVIIEWLDSRQPTGSWQFLSDVQTLDACDCRSVGYLVHEGDGVKVLAPNMADVHSDDIQASGFIVIPECSIQRVTTLNQIAAREPVKST